MDTHLSETNNEYFLFERCFSATGKKGGKQVLSLGKGCQTKGVIIHELLHALGMMHEHCRPDRNQFIRINASNIKQSKHGWLCYRVMQGRVAAMDVSCKSSTLGPVSRKPRKLFGPIKPFLIHLYLKKGEVHAPETSCMKRTSVQIKNF